MKNKKAFMQSVQKHMVLTAKHKKRLIMTIAAVIIAVTLTTQTVYADNLSMLDQIRQLIRFSHGQKTYKYRRLNEWGDV